MQVTENMRANGQNFQESLLYPIQAQTRREKIMAFTAAVKYGFTLKMVIAGIAGVGKTYTSFQLATELSKGQRFAVIDTERGASRKYADEFQFDISELALFSPQKYIQEIREAEKAGYKVLVIDGLSQAWNGPGGMLEIVDRIAKLEKNNNSFQAWNDANPILLELLDTILKSPLHIICTMRSKTEYLV